MWKQQYPTGFGSIESYGAHFNYFLFITLNKYIKGNIQKIRFIFETPSSPFLIYFSATLLFYYLLSLLNFEDNESNYYENGLSKIISKFLCLKILVVL